ATVVSGGQIVWGTSSSSSAPPPQPSASPPAAAHSVQHPTGVNSPTTLGVDSGKTINGHTEKAPLLSANHSSEGLAIDIDDGEVVRSSTNVREWLILAVQIALLVGIFAALGYATDSAFQNQLLVFVLSVVVGYNIVWSVTAALHTPLMSVTNAISGIIILGLMLQTRHDDTSTSVILALI